MAAAVALSNYQLGDLLGRGASGSVYRALNFLTGETVAIKSVSLLTLSPSALPDIMSEIDLLKNLNHPNIVKYKGFARDKDNLFIVLEYCENGSLQTILKKFGKFPESLVAVYISQVLEGLIYLHDQGVVHRDIKGANILTNKDGSVKLADFGVSSKTGGNDNEVVGSPYWMAPEVIEQSGGSTASDIWSVGCVVVELLEGRPPYGDLAPMQALWRIVQDESMRIPDGASPIVRDFLYHCFQKDPHLRITAKKLLKHPWMQSARRHVESPLASQPRSREVSAKVEVKRIPSSERRLKEKSVNPVDMGTVRQKPLTVYDEAVQKVQEWNEALNAAPKGAHTVRRIPSVRPRNPSGAIPLTSLPSFPLPTRGSADSIAAQAPSSAHASPAHPTGLVGKSQHVTDALSRARESETAEKWDDDFADVSLSKLGHHRSDSSMSEEQDQMTLKAFKSPEALRPRVEASIPRAIPESTVEDYSDIGVDESEVELESKLANLKIKGKGRKGILHPDDLRKIKSLAPPPKPVRTLSTPSPAAAPAPLSTFGSTPSRRRVSPNLGPPQSPNLHPRSPPTSRQNSLRANPPNEVDVELQKYQEDDEDWDDMFGDGGEGQALEPKTPSLQLTRRSNRSWRSTEEEDQDPFAGLDDDFDMSEDIEANLLRDKKATLCGKIERLVAGLVPGGDDLKAVCDELLGLLEETRDLGLERHFASAHGMLAVLEVLESRISRDVAVRLLRIVNFIVGLDVDMLESFCLIGGIPVVIPYTSKKHSIDTRLEASTFIHHLTLSPLTLQMFISCRGLRILVELLDEDYISNRTLILSALEGIGSVFDLQSPTPRNDFCRMFVREGILDPLSTALLSILRDTDLSGSAGSKSGSGMSGKSKESEGEMEHAERAMAVLLLFCQVAQADARVREAFANRTIVIRLLKACDALPRKLLVTAIKAIKHLSTSPQLIEVLQNSNAMEVLVGLLGKTTRGLHSNEICSHIFQTIYSMCRLSKARQEEAASAGIIPLLKRVILQKSPLKQFALPILCDLANAGKVSRRLLWHNDGLKLYLDLLEDPYWRVSALDAILAWMQDETARVEDVLAEKTASENLVKCFVQSTGISNESILDPFLKILRLSSSVTSTISTPAFFRRLSDSLEKTGKAVTKLNLLRITRVVCEHHPDRQTLVERFGLADIVERLAKQDEAVLVRELAKEVIPILLFGNTNGDAVGGGGSGLGVGVPPGSVAKGILGQRGGSAMRRTTSETIIDVGRGERQGAHSAMGGNMATGPSVASGLSTMTAAVPSAHHRGISQRDRLRPVGGDESRSGESSASSSSRLASSSAGPPIAGERPKHKRKISRSQLREVQWQTDENGRLKSVRAPSKTS